MITYRELSSLSSDLGFSAKALYSVSNDLDSHYHSAQIPKGDSGERQLSVPDSFLKTIQVRIYERLLSLETISPYATAYRPGGSTLVNAKPHVGQSAVLKLDVRNFYDNLVYPIVKAKAFPAERYSEANRILLAILCTYRGSLPQGAPSSPAISNIVMRDFDDAIGEWCRGRRIRFTRYCDDLTFSGTFQPADVIARVESELHTLGLYLNRGKTVFVRSGQRHMVTGIVVNEQAHIPAAYKRRLRQELYYCIKFGVDSHMKKKSLHENREHYMLSLLGKVNYVLSVEPGSREMLRYRNWLSGQLRQAQP